MCKSSSDCFSDIKSFTSTKFTQGNTFKSGDLTILGIAKDGHLIIGPFIKGQMVDCFKQLDQCNGMFLQDGSYVYVFTNTFPYSVGCFGPSMPQYF
jgi:hypothetical protein